MNTLLIPELKTEVSRFALGCATFSLRQRATAYEVVDAYRGVGGNLIDTAKSYGGGDSERALGRWLTERGSRNEVVLMDKGCREDGSLTANGIREAIEVSLARLGTRYLDLWVVHRDHPDTPVQVLVETVNEQVEEGRIRGYGLSNWSVSRIAAARKYAEEKELRGPAISSLHLSLAAPMEPLWSNCLHASEEEVASHAEMGLPLLAWSPLGHGFFSDHSGPEPDSDERVERCYRNEENMEKLARARKLAEEKGVTAAQIALAYVLNLPGPIVAVVGAQSAREVQSCAAATEIELSEGEMAWLGLKAAER